MTRAPVTSILAASGAGSRLGGGPPKAFRSLGNEPLFVHALRCFDACAEIDSHVLVVPRGSVDEARRSVGALRADLRIVEGGAHRQDSVLAGLIEAERAWPSGTGGEVRIVAVHDAARPFPDPDLILRTIEGARSAGAAVPVLPVSDTVREVGPTGESLRVLDRAALRLAQTPQTARLDWLLDAYRRATASGADITDEGGALEAAGYRIALVAGSPGNFKITTPGDLRMAEALVSPPREIGALRVGYGEDRHPRAPGRPFVIAGVRLAESDGPAGHSDGDPLCHALVDAILGAASAGSIGDLFPDTDPAWSGASGPDLLARAAGHVGSLGFRVLNVDAVVVADAPRLAPHVPGIRRAIAAALGVEEDRVSLKGKRAEGLGFEGAGLGVSCRATALLVKDRVP